MVNVTFAMSVFLNNGVYNPVDYHNESDMHVADYESGNIFVIV